MSVVSERGVVVLLATYNAGRFLDEQVASILSQEGLMRLVISDDGSRDGTAERVAALAAKDARVRVLPAQRSGSSAANFFRLLRDADVSGAEAIALADQDDVWLPGRLPGHLRLLRERGAHGVSSDMIAFDDATGREFAIVKSQPQRLLDWLTQTPGAGCTFTMSPRLHALVRETLLAEPELTAAVEAHDWLIYAIARATGLRWIISAEPTVRYRQHAANDVGANHGARAALSRLARMRDGWHRSQVAAVSAVCQRVPGSAWGTGAAGEVDGAAGRTAPDATAPDAASPPEDARARTAQHWRAVDGALADRSLPARVRLLREVGHLRRSLRDRLALAATIALGLW